MFDTSFIKTIETSLDEITALNVLMQANCNSIIGTPVVKLGTKLSKDRAFAVEQQALITVAEAYFANDKSPQYLLVANLSSVIGTINRWLAFAPRLSSLLPSNKTEFNVGIQALINANQTSIKGYQETLAGLDNFNTTLTNTYDRLSTEQAAIKKLLGSDISSLEKQVNDLNNTMAEDNAVNARGATKQGLGILIIVAVVIAEAFKSSGSEEAPEPSDESAEIISSSVNIIRDDMKEQTAASIEWQKSFEAYRKLITALASDEQLYAAVMQICSTANQLITQMKEVITAQQNLVNAWTKFDTQLNTIYQTVKSGGNTDEVKVLLEEMSQGFTELHNQAVALQSTGAVRTTKEDSFATA